MGINNLYSLIKKNAPEQMVVYELSELSSLSIAIDISVFLYQFKLAGDNEFINLFIYFLCKLRKYGIKAVCIFDGDYQPYEKKLEQIARRKSRQTQIENMNDMIKILNDVKNNIEEYSTEGLPEDIQLKVKNLLSRKRIKGEINYSDPYDIKQTLQQQIHKVKNQASSPTKENIQLAKEIISLFGLNQYTAHGEAEKLCAYLNINGYVDAVLTEDTDVLAYGTPFMLAFKELKDDKIYGIHHPSLIKSLDLSHNEFLDLCILLRCDYNRYDDDGEPTKVLGYPPDGKNRKKPCAIGETSAWCFIKEYRTLEEISSHIEDITPLRYKRCRELFSFEDADEYKEYIVKNNKRVKFGKIKKFLELNECKVSFEYIQKSFDNVKILLSNEILNEENSNEDFHFEEF